MRYNTPMRFEMQVPYCQQFDPFSYYFFPKRKPEENRAVPFYFKRPLRRNNQPFLCFDRSTNPLILHSSGLHKCIAGLRNTGKYHRYEIQSPMSILMDHILPMQDCLIEQTLYPFLSPPPSNGFAIR